MPILLKNEPQVLEVIRRLGQYNILPRRYFYPSLSTVKTLDAKGEFPVSEDLARRVLCLPLYDTLPEEQIAFICSIIKY